MTKRLTFFVSILLLLGLCNYANVENEDLFRDTESVVWDSIILPINGRHEEALVNAIYLECTKHFRLFSQQGWDETIPEAMSRYYNESEGFFPIMFFCTTEDEFDFENIQSLRTLMPDYEILSLAYDALSFIVNRNNKIGNINTDDIQNIYSGENKNWGFFGGEDLPIIAYQRSDEIYAQEVMRDNVMKGKDMADPPMRFTFPDADCFDIVPLELGYDNSLTAIGYSMYRYIRNRYDNDIIKVLSVNGIACNEESIRNKEYPYYVTLYTAFPKSTPHNHPNRQLIDWLLSDEGQSFLFQFGFIPLKEIKIAENINRDNSVIENSRRISTGTGGKIKKSRNTDIQMDDPVVFPDATRWECYEELAWVDSSINQIITNWVEEEKKTIDVCMDNDSFQNHDYNTYFYKYGNLVSVHMSTGKCENERISTAVFDAETGIRLKLSDVFFDEYNYIVYINNELVRTSMQKGSQILGAFSFIDEKLRRPFDGIDADYPYFLISPTGSLLIAFDGNNPFVLPTYWQNLFLVEIELNENISPYR